MRVSFCPTCKWVYPGNSAGIAFAKCHWNVQFVDFRPDESDDVIEMLKSQGYEFPYSAILDGPQQQIS